MSATIVVGHINDEELKKSISSLVAYVKEETGNMATAFDEKITEMENRLKSLGSAKVDLGQGVSGKESTAIKQEEKLAEAKKKTAQAQKEVNMNLDEGAQTQSRMVSASSTPMANAKGIDDLINKLHSLELEKQKALSDNMPLFAAGYDMQIEVVKNKIREMAQGQQQVTQAVQGTTQAQNQLTQGAHQYAEEVRRAVDAISNRKTATQAFEKISLMPQGSMEEIRQKGKALQELIQKVKDTPLMSQTNVRLAEKMLANLARRYAELKNAAAAAAKEPTAPVSASATTKSSLEEQKRSLEELKAKERERREAIIQTGIAAQAQAQTYRESIAAQMSTADYTRQVDKVQELQIALKQMQDAYKQMPEDHALRKELEADINLTRQALEIANRYNMVVAGLGAVGVGGTAPKDTIAVYSAELQRLAGIYRNLTAEERNSAAGRNLVNKYQDLTKVVREAQQQLSRPTNLAQAMKGEENSIDAIMWKMQQLQAYKRGLNFTDPKQASELRIVDDKLKQLDADLKKYTGTTKLAQGANSALTRSWNYMKNRLAFYFTVGASTQFIKNLIEVRAQYEMTERSLGILVQSAERGSEIFRELSSMALVSPYTLIELSSAAKQLTAYDIAAKDVVDTTRRLGDMAAAVGIPIDRLTYALGQIKAYGYLNARDARMFSNAGIPLVAELSRHYTELRGTLVSVADVYDMIKKKQVGMEDVMSVITEMTDEGGKFFNFQEKLAGTLKVELANLTLAWNNMLNAIGQDTQGILTSSIRGLKEAFLHWKTLNKTILDVAIAVGSFKAVQLLLNAAIGKGTVAALSNAKASATTSVAEYKSILTKRQLNAEQARLIVTYNAQNKVLQQAILELKLLTQEEIAAAAGAGKMGSSFKTAGLAIRTAGSSIAASLSAILSPASLVMLAVIAVTDAFMEWRNNEEEIAETTKTLSEHSKEAAESIQSYLDSYGITDATNIGLAEQAKNWEAMREQIELASNASSYYLRDLLQITNLGDRLNAGVKVLKQIQDVRTKMQQWGDVDVPKGFSVIGLTLKAGLADELKNYAKAEKEVGVEAKQAGENLNGFERRLTLLNDNVRRIGQRANLLSNWLDLDWQPRADTDKFAAAKAQLASDVADLAGELKAQMEKSLILDPKSIIEATNSWLTSYGEKVGMEEKDLQTLRIMLFDEFRKTAEQGFVGMSDTQRREWVNTMSFNQAAYENFLTLAIARHRHVFTNMTQEEIDNNKWLTDDRKKALDETLEYLKQNNYLAYLNAKDYVDHLNQLKILIPISFQVQITPAVQEILKNAGVDPNLVPNASSIEGSISTLQKAQDDYAKELKRLDNLKKKGVSVNQEYYNQVKEDEKTTTDAIHNLNALTKAEEAAQKQRNKGRGGKHTPKPEDLVAKALKDEISLIKEMQSNYDKLRKAGVRDMEAIAIASQGYEKTIASINVQLRKFGIKEFAASDFAGKDTRAIRDALQKQLSDLLKNKKIKRESLKELEGTIKNLNLDVKQTDAQKIVETLNSELQKIDEGYELALAFEGDPQLAESFAEMFGLDEGFLDSLPHGIMEKYQRIQDALTKALNKGYDLAGKNIFNLFDIQDLHKWAEGLGLDTSSELFKEIEKAYKGLRKERREMLKETEKEFEDAIKSFGLLGDKIGEIEGRRLESLRKLKEATPADKQDSRNIEYTSKLDAINKKAEREKTSALFEDFKNSDLYIAMFQRIGNASTIMLETMRDRLERVKASLKDLTPEQLKFFAEKMEQIDLELVKRNPFKKLASNTKAYFKAFSKQSKAQLREQLKSKQDQYDIHNLILRQLEESYEKEKHEEKPNQKMLDYLEGRIIAQRKIVENAGKELQEVEALANKYNLLKKISKEQWGAIAKGATTAAANLQSLGQLRDFIQNDLGIELSAELNGLVDGLTKVGEGINNVISSATSGNVVGALGGLGQVFYGIFDGFLSIFGDGSARTKKLEKDIERSERAVKRLEVAYVELEHAMNKAYGTAVIGAQKAAIENKKLQLTELNRQLQLEQSKRSKDRDEDKIIDLQKQIKQLENEIQDATDDIVNNLLGISSVGDAVENMVGVVIDALRSGEDAIGAFNESIDDMIVNLIKKFVATKMLGPIFEKAWDAVQERIMARKTGTEYARLVKREAALRPYSNYAETGAMRSYYLDWLAVKKKLAEYDEVTKDDLRYYIDVLNGLKGEGQGLVDFTEELLKEYGLGKTGDKELSALQQGIQSITEETANSIEAYLNGISQQIYLHSDLLTQIRDAIVQIDADVQTTTQAQMLLQLQQSYQVQMSIQGILEGWSNPNGMAVRVEMV